MANSSGNIHIDTIELKALSEQLEVLGPGVVEEIRSALRDGLIVLRDEARRNSAYSSRIPGSIRTRTNKARMAGYVTAGGKAAPDAAAIENKGKGYVRHPTFGHLPWTNKSSHPAFFAPAVEKKKDEVQAIVYGRISALIDRFSKKRLR